MRRFPLVLAVAAGLLAAVPPLGGQSRKHRIPEGLKKKRFHATLYALHPDDKAWRDIGEKGLGVRFKGEGVVLIFYRKYFEAPGGRPRLVFKFGGKEVKPTNISTVARELQKKIIASTRKAFKPGKPRKFRCKAGKGVYTDVVVSGGEEEFGIKELEAFTSAAAGLDASRSFSPRTIKMHYRPVLIKAKDGVHYLTMMATEGVLRKHRKAIDRFLKSFAPR